MQAKPLFIGHQTNIGFYAGFSIYLWNTTPEWNSKKDFERKIEFENERTSWAQIMSPISYGTVMTIHGII